MEVEHVSQCPECLVGVLRSRRVSYLTALEGQLVWVPDFPAWVCDVCGRREYDASALDELWVMLESNPHVRRKQKRSRTKTKPERPRTTVNP